MAGSLIFHLQLADDGEELDVGDLSVTQLTGRYQKTGGIVKETITCLQPVQLKMLQMTNFMETVLEQQPEIKMGMDLEKNEISFEGDAKTVISGYRNLVETRSKYGLNRINDKPVEHIELYKRKRVVEYINTRLEKQNIVCAWEVKDQIIAVCSHEKDIAKCTKLIDGSVTEITFPVSKESVVIFFTTEWQKTVENIQDTHDLVYNVSSDKTSTTVTVIATDTDTNESVGHIKIFLESQLEIDSETIYRPERISEKFKQLYDLNSTLPYLLITQIERSMSKLFHVTIKREYVKGSRINPLDGFYTHILTGTRDGRAHAKKRIAELDMSF